MAKKPSPLVGIHPVPRRLKNGTTRWHVYAWRGGPKIMSADSVLQPSLTPEAVNAYARAHELKEAKRPPETFAAVAASYVGSPEYRNLAKATKSNWRGWIDRATDRFGDAPLRLFEDKRMRGQIMDWRSQWGHSPRQADFAIQVIGRILSHAIDRGELTSNPAFGIEKLYKADRSEITWTDDEIDAVADMMQPHVAMAFRLAAWTGLSRGDLVGLRWSQVFNDFIYKKRSKTRIPQVVPLFDETVCLIAKLGSNKTAVTVVTNRRGKPFTSRGFAMAVERARDEAGVAKGKTLHDLRGTFATRLMNAGFDDREIDQILGWTPGKSEKVRPFYIGRSVITNMANERMRKYREQVAGVLKKQDGSQLHEMRGQAQLENNAL